MRGGIVREGTPYGDEDLEREFGKSHVLVLTGGEYSASPVSDPERTPVRAPTAEQLAEKLRAEGQDA